MTNEKQEKEIIRAMLEVVSLEPIRNTGSYALTLLWQIFERAQECMECDTTLTDDEIETLFERYFEPFILAYPLIMTLETTTND
jgi:hypothetical protein